MSHLNAFSVISLILLLGDQPVSISGRITDAAGSPLPGVEITLKQLRRSVITDRDGRYAFSCLPDGTYSLAFDIEGFLPKTIEDIVCRYPNTVELNEMMHIRPDVGTRYGTGTLLTVRVIARTTGQVLADARVALSGVNESERTYGTDACGRAFWILKRGEYRMRVKAVGFQDHERIVSIIDTDVSVEVRLDTR